jgi:hypothetical protein
MACVTSDLVNGEVAGLPDVNPEQVRVPAPRAASDRGSRAIHRPGGEVCFRVKVVEAQKASDENHREANQPESQKTKRG